MIAKELIDFYQPRVEKGVSFLDEYYPGWAEKIDVDALRLRSVRWCICGQIFGDFDLRPDKLSNAYLYGFALSINDDPFPIITPEGQDASWAALNALWLDEIHWRIDS